MSRDVLECLQCVMEVSLSGDCIELVLWACVGAVVFKDVLILIPGSLAVGTVSPGSFC
jgi:hypothetical protein